MSKRPPEKGKALVPANGTDGGGSKVPALKSTNFHINFLALTTALDEQVQLWDELCDLWRERNKPVDLFHEVDDVWAARELWTSVREGAEQCLATMNALWTSRMPDPNIDSPSAEWLGWRIGEMTKAWGGNSKMSADEMLYMADRLEAENLHGMTWEGIFREIEDTRSKAPTINEVLEFLKKTKHIADWKRRLAAIDFEQIQQKGEETVFALEHKQAIFEEAVFHFLDGHGYADLAEAVYVDPSCSWKHAIYVTEAQRLLTSEKHVMLEWQLLLKNAQRCLNQDKVFVCISCYAGYVERPDHCKVCGTYTWTIVSQWDEYVAHQHTELQVELQAELQRLQRAQKRREKTAEPRWQQHYEARTVKTLVSTKRAIDARTKELLQEQAAIQADLDSYYVNGQLK